MDKTSDKLFCTIVCLGIASLAGFGGMAALMIIGPWTFLQALFAAAVIWALLSAFLVGVICGGTRETPAEARNRIQAEKEAARAKLAAVAPAPVAQVTPRAKVNAPQAAAAAAPAPTMAPAPTAAPAADPGVRPAGLSGARDGKADDLKQIKGIGPKLEVLCHSLGFYHFDQIAAWTAAEVAWVDENLEGFKGRVTRDEWVAQAKVLAAGGETEFSKRVEGGDIY